MLRSVAFASLVVVGLGCSTPPGSKSSGGATHPHATGSGAPPDAAPERTAGPTAAECTTLFAHAVAIRIAEQKDRPPPTAAEQAELRAQLEAEAGPACRAGSRTTYECGMAAKTLAELEACP